MEERQKNKFLMKNKKDLVPFRNKIVKLYINNEDDLYNKFTFSGYNKGTVPDGAEINPQIIEYLLNETRDLLQFIGVSPEIRVNGISENELEKVEELIRTEIKKRILKINIKLFKMKHQSIILLLGAIVPLTIQQIFSQFIARYALKELFLVMAWVFIWKAVELIFFERKEITKEKNVLKRLLKSEFLHEPRDVS